MAHVKYCTYWCIKLILMQVISNEIPQYTSSKVLGFYTATLKLVAACGVIGARLVCIGLFKIIHISSENSYLSKLQTCGYRLQEMKMCLHNINLYKYLFHVLTKRLFVMSARYNVLMRSIHFYFLLTND